MDVKNAQNVALVLGSGGARGLAHIGVVEVLQERGYQIVSVSGCSMGALVGAFVAAGKLPAFKDWVCSLSYMDVLRLVDLSFLANGSIKGDKIFSHISSLLGPIDIEDLSIPYTAVSADLISQKEVWFQTGPLELALRATIAIPSLLAPVVSGNRVLVDGGVLNPLPIAPSVSAHADHIIAIDLSTDIPMPEELKLLDDQAKQVAEDNLSDGTGDEGWLDSLVSRASQWFGSEQSGDSDAVPRTLREEELMVANLGKIGIMNEMFETMQASLTQYKIAGYPPDLLIQVPKNCARIYEFYRATELVALGRVVAEKALDKYEAQGRTV